MARNLPRQLVLELGGKIIGGEIPPGTILTSDTLEAQFGVSRTVVREALKVLHDKGLTRARTKTGTIVLERQEWNLLDPDVIAWLRTSGLAPELLKDLEEFGFDKAQIVLATNHGSRVLQQNVAEQRMWQIFLQLLRR